MGFLSKIFGTNPETEKENKFQEIERQFIGKFELANLHKAQWLTNRGNDFRQRGQFDQAIKDFRDAIKLNPNHIHAYISLGMVYAKQGMLKEAIDVLEKAPKENTGFNVYYIHELLSALGMMYMEADNKEKAIDYFEKSLKVYNDIQFNSAIMELQKTHKKSAKGHEQEWEEREINTEMVATAKELLKQLKQESELQVVFLGKNPQSKKIDSDK
jgi:tetratricopeptide (TPR) repeat protein